MHDLPKRHELRQRTKPASGGAETQKSRKAGMITAILAASF